MATRHSINGLVEILTWMESLDYDRNTLLANTHIDPARLTDPNGTVSNKEELTFYKNLLGVSNDPNIYLKAGMTLNIGAYGLWGLALLSSPTVGKAIEFGLQYIAFSYTYNTIDFFSDKHTSSLIITSSQSLGTLEKPMVERDISAIYMIFTALLQNSHPLNHIRVSWKSGGESESALYQKLFQCPVTFDCSINEVVF
ncbi:MAG: AraC family transcriptional regulator, partial [Pseudomonadales bacterium]|nr:AraC family transcriptional regulator [Pseudomonadales bacterium]